MILETSEKRRRRPRSQSQDDVAMETDSGATGEKKIDEAK